MFETTPIRWPMLLLLISLFTLLFVGIAHWGLFLPEPDEYDRTTVAVETDNGEPLATAEVRIADTMYKQYIGLSRTDALAEDEGMLFVHGEEADRRYAMRGMEVSIDIVFIDADGRITTIYSADAPDTFADRVFYDTYPGRGKWVLEMPRGWAAEHGIEEGDTVRDLPT